MGSVSSVIEIHGTIFEGAESKIRENSDPWWGNNIVHEIGYMGCGLIWKLLLGGF